MKKLTVLILALIMTLSLASCGSKSDGDTSGGGKKLVISRRCLVKSRYTIISLLLLVMTLILYCISILRTKRISPFLLMILQTPCFTRTALKSLIYTTTIPG